MDQITLNEAFADAKEVNNAFSFIERRFNGIPCRECKSRQTIATIICGTVTAGCENCGGATRIGPLLGFWTPGQSPQTPQARPVLRSAPERIAPRRGQAGRGRPQ